MRLTEREEKKKTSLESDSNAQGDHWKNRTPPNLFDWHSPFLFSFWQGNVEYFKCQTRRMKYIIKAFWRFFLFSRWIPVAMPWRTGSHPLLLQRHTAGSIRYSGVPPPLFFFNAASLCVIYQEGLFHSLNQKLKRLLPLSRLQSGAFCHKLYRSVKCFTAAAHLLDVTWQLYF